MNFLIETSVGKIAISDTGDIKKNKKCILFIHGNSSSKVVFNKQLTSPLLSEYRLIALDLPGHGDSSNANNPETDYTISSYAKLICELAGKFELSSIIVVGWSLGGHIAIEAIAQGLDAKAMVISGTPPVGPGLEHMTDAFKVENLEDAGKLHFNEGEVTRFASATMGGESLVTNDIRQAVARCDGFTRKIMIEASAVPDSGANQRNFVEQWNNPIAVLQGEDDVFVQSDYLKTIHWKNLWRGKVQFFENVGHAPFWQDADKFNQLLSEFVHEL